MNPLGPHRVPYWEDGEPLPPARISAEVHGWADGPSRTFSLRAAATRASGICIGGERARELDRHRRLRRISGPATVGAAYTWSTRRFEWIGGACDLGRWTVPRPASAARRAAAGRASLTLPAGLPVAAFKVTGSRRCAARDGHRAGRRARAHAGRAPVARGRRPRLVASTSRQAPRTSRSPGRPAARGGSPTDAGSTPIASATEAQALPPRVGERAVGGRGVRGRCATGSSRCRARR